MSLRLGKQPARIDPRTLRFEAYTQALPTPPPSDTDNLHRYSDWGMLGNGPDDTVTPGFQGAGDCVFAGGDHEHMDWMCIAGWKPPDAARRFSGKTAIQDYSAVTGYDPAQTTPDGTNPTDQGTVVLDALNYRRRTGLVDTHGQRHQIGGYVSVNPTNTLHVKQAIRLFDAVGIGFRFPSTAMDQFNRGKPWDLVPGATDEGGHYVPLIGYDSTFVYPVSWGRVQPMTWRFLQAQCDEAFAIYSPDFLRGGKRSPEGLNAQQLLADLHAVTG